MIDREMTYRASEIANLTGLSTAAILKYCRKGWLEAAKLSSGQWLIWGDDWLTFVATHGRQQPSWDYIFAGDAFLEADILGESLGRRSGVVGSWCHRGLIPNRPNGQPGCFKQGGSEKSAWAIWRDAVEGWYPPAAKRGVPK